MDETRIALLAVFCALFLGLAMISSCATNEHRSRTGAEQTLSHKKKKGKRQSDDFRLYGRDRDLNKRVLKRGQRAMHRSALDPY